MNSSPQTALDNKNGRIYPHPQQFNPLTTFNSNCREVAEYIFSFDVLVLFVNCVLLSCHVITSFILLSLSCHY